MDLSQWLLIVCVCLFTAVAAVWDWRTNRLPNWLTVSAFFIALVFHLTVGGIQGGWTGAGSSLLTALAGCATGFGILFVLWLIGGGGGGDVKLMGALGAWLGPEHTVWVFLLSAVIVLFETIAVLVWQATQLGVVGAKARYFNRRREAGQANATAPRRRRVMPYGIPVALATWCVLVIISIKG
jgi:prepilin peptidase CpaA